MQVVQRLLDRPTQHRQRGKVLVRRAMTQGDQRGGDTETRGEMRDWASIRT